jgi:hypothetical protein
MISMTEAIAAANAAMAGKAAVFRVRASCGSVHCKQRAVRWPSR